MQKIKFIIAILIVTLSSFHSKGQVAALTNQSYLQIAPRVGYDIKPMFDNNTPYINYKGGLHAGVSFDYYFKKWGIGADVDYIKNKPQSTYPTTGLKNAALVPLTSFSLKNQSITRLFYGIGPSYKFQSVNGKMTTELNARIGMASIKGGRVEHRETTTLSNELLNFHAGYNASVLSAKAQVRTSYFFKPNIGVSFGAYYLYHFKVPELLDPALGFSAKYADVTSTLSGGNALTGKQNVRTQPCNCGVSSIGVFAGVVIKIAKKSKDKEVCLPEYSLAVTAKDKYTGELLPETEVVVKNSKGEVAFTGLTNSFGVIVFDKIMPEDYTIAGTLAKIALDGNSAAKSEFMSNKNKVVQKTILYSSRNFIIKGKIYECNSTKAIPNISVVIGKVDLSYVDMTLSKEDGSYMLQIPEASGDYSLYGKKDKYYSQIETVNPADYNRDKNLFIKLEICAERVDCGKTLLLKNILFDLDKYAIKDAAKKELNKLVQFMKDNPAVKVELSSHTDCRNTAEYNQTLSQNRANASVDYLVSQGISRERLTGVGYGETKLLNRCADGVNCTEAEHSINRRTEMKVICPTNN